MENRESILQMVRWGTRLSLALFSVCGASGDLNRLAKKVNKFSLVLRQVGSRLQEDTSIPSPESVKAVTHILHQAQGVFSEVEAIVPQAAEYVRDTNTSWTSVEVGKTWEWDEASEDKAHYLLEHLEALALTLQVMLQTFYTVKITVWSRRQQNTQTSRDAVATERLQLQSLVIEQQLCFLSVHRLYLDYHLDAVAPSQTVPVSEERQPRPQHLVQYQEDSLVAADTDNTESQRLEVVRRVAGPFIDELLRRWTMLEDIEARARQTEFQQDAQLQRELEASTRASLQPSVEEDDDENDLKHPIPKSSAPGPLLTPTSETQFLKIATPIPIPRSKDSVDTSTKAASAPFTRPDFFPPSPAHSPLAGVAPTPPGPNVVGLPSPTPIVEESEGMGIPWTLKIHKHRWDFNDTVVVDSNSQLQPSEFSLDKPGRTEIHHSWVHPKALEEKGYEFVRVTKEVNAKGRTKFEPAFQIQRRLSFREVETLVLRSGDIFSQDYPSRAASPTHPPPPANPPPFDRSMSLPLVTTVSDSVMIPQAPPPFPQQPSSFDSRMYHDPRRPLHVKTTSTYPFPQQPQSTAAQRYAPPVSPNTSLPFTSSPQTYYPPPQQPPPSHLHPIHAATPAPYVSRSNDSDHSDSDHTRRRYDRSSRDRRDRRDSTHSRSSYISAYSEPAAGTRYKSRGEGSRRSGSETGNGGTRENGTGGRSVAHRGTFRGVMAGTGVAALVDGLVDNLGGF